MKRTPPLSLHDRITATTANERSSRNSYQWPDFGHHYMRKKCGFHLTALKEASLTPAEFAYHILQGRIHELSHLIGPPFSGIQTPPLSEGMADFLSLHSTPEHLPAIADFLLSRKPETWIQSGDLTPIYDLLKQFTGRDPTPVPCNTSYASSYLFIEGVTERTRQRYSWEDDRPYTTLAAFCRWTADLREKCREHHNGENMSKATYAQHILDYIAELIKIDYFSLQLYSILQREGQDMVRHYLEHGMDNPPPIKEKPSQPEPVISDVTRTAMNLSTKMRG